MTGPERRRVYLMRHCDVAYFADPARPVAAEAVQLTDRGVAQARAAGRALAGVRIDRVLTSGLPRTEETARLVVAELADAPGCLEFDAWPELQEFRPGEPSVIADHDLEESFLGPFRGVPHPSASYLGGESVASLCARVAAALGRLYADPSWHTILAVLHGGVNRAILSWALAGPGAYFAQFEQSPGAINLIDGEIGNFVLRGVNFAPSDPVHLGPRTTTVEEILAQYRVYRRAEFGR